MASGPGDDVRRWVTEQTGRRVAGWERLVGGMSSEVWRGHLADGSTVVVRHIVDRDWLAREPDLIDRERTALELLAGTEVPAPRLIGSDAERGLLVMTDLPGALRADRPFVIGHVAAMAEAAARIAEVPVPSDCGLVPWRPWLPAEPVPPAWGDAGLWARAIELVVDRPAPTGPPVLLHRDLHPLNLLWAGERERDDRLSGVVDWVNACVGHPHAELGHCRWNLAVLGGLEAADRFLDHYLRLGDGGPYDPWWDVADVVSFLPGPIGVTAWRAVGRTDLTPPFVIERTEHFLRAALHAR